MNILRFKTTAKKCDVVPMTIRRWATLPEYAHLKFPKPVALTDNIVGFVESEIDAWLEARAAERDDTDADGNDADGDDDADDDADAKAA